MYKIWSEASREQNLGDPVIDEIFMMC